MAYLYGASVQGIQNFIFETNELKTIVGASEIIKNINKQVEEKYAKNIIINAAGNVKLIFDEDEKNKLEDLVLNFIKDIQQQAYGIIISQAVVKFEKGGLKEAFKQLEKNLFIQRNKSTIPLDSSINIIELAPKTAKPAVEKAKDKSTLLKEKINTSKGDMPKNKKNKTAIIHIDGNGLGAMIASMLKNLNDDEEVIKAYKNFSTNLEKTTKEAFKEAKKDIPENELREVIRGGDDVSVICNANYALSFTKKFLKEFEKYTKELLGTGGLTACAGIAYCNHKYPFHYAINLAESLCSYSKKHSKNINKNLAPSSLMFHNIQSSNFNDYNEYIKKELTLQNDKEIIYLNYGPYFVNPQDNYSTIEDFSNICKAFMKKGSPISRLREWLTILGQNSVEAKERLKRINEMMELKDDMFKKESLENALRKFNKDIKIEELTFIRENKRYTPIGDVDMYLSAVDWS